jgi:hypothetical protein
MLDLLDEGINRFFETYAKYPSKIVANKMTMGRIIKLKKDMLEGGWIETDLKNYKGIELIEDSKEVLFRLE